jgi:hypothetical protein
VDFVYEEASHAIWRSHPGAVSQSAAASGSDPGLRAFAATLAPEAYVVDLRTPKTEPSLGVVSGRRAAVV